MDNGTNTTVADCKSRAVHCTKNDHQNWLKLFPSATPLAFMALDILGPSRKIKYGTEPVIVLTNASKNLLRAIQAATET